MHLRDTRRCVTLAVVIDHLVFATPNLEATVAELAERLGVEPVPGGRHVGRGTRNELVGLGRGAYLEIIGPDLDDPHPQMAFGIERPGRAGLAAWCARPDRPLEAVVADARAAGFDPGEIGEMSRRRPDDVLLRWRLTQPVIGPDHIAPLPFLIDWLDSPHPAASLPEAAELLQLRLDHPDAALISDRLAALGELDSLEVVESPEIRLVAMLRTPNGVLSLT